MTTLHLVPNEDRWVLSNKNSYYETRLGVAYVGNTLDLIKEVESESVDLIITSPPFALTRKKAYGNVPPEEYVEWFEPFAEEFWRVLKTSGSFVVHLGTSWEKGKPFKSLYIYELILTLCTKYKKPFHLAQEFFWYNPAKLPSPAEWVTVRRIRVKDAVDFVLWFCKTDEAKSNNRKVLKQYSKSMKNLLKNGYTAKRRPSEHQISKKFKRDHGGAIPPNLLVPNNLLAFSNTASTNRYLKLCRENKDIAKINPARYPEDIPEFFMRFLTDKNDRILEPFAGSNTTGYVAEILGRKWMAFELIPEYTVGSIFRFNIENIVKCANHKALEVI